MKEIDSLVFVVKLVVVILTLSYAIYRIEGFQQSVGGRHPLTHNNPFRNPHWPPPLSVKPTKKYAPSQVVTDEISGERWRLCSGVAVLNSRNQLLIGERKGRPGNWQCPQGGVDDARAPFTGSNMPKEKETIVEAATREMFEEIGLEIDCHVMIDPTYPLPSLNNNTGVRYSTAGSSNWLTEAGFAGQELHWTVFRCMDGRGDQDPNEICDVSGNGGENAEFTQVKWQEVDAIVENIWEGKRAPYIALQSMIKEHEGDWEELIRDLDFSGKWSRNPELCINLVEALMERGLPGYQAKEEAAKPYIQLWERDMDDNFSWHVTTYQDDGTTPRRQLKYKPGSWEEKYQGESALFGNTVVPITLRRETSYVGDINADPIPVAHVTITDGPRGIEESRRYRRGDHLYLERTFWPNEAPKSPIVTTEVFVR